MTIVPKPWGYERIWAHTATYVGKLLHIQAGHQLSLQFHRVKEETIYVMAGTMVLLIEDDDHRMLEVTMVPGDVRHIAPGRKHRMMAVTECDVIEVSTPELEDVVRLEDAYGRIIA